MKNEINKKIMLNKGVQGQKKHQKIESIKNIPVIDFIVHTL